MATYSEILQKHAEAAAEEMKAEAAKDAAQREAETLADEINALAGQLAPLQKFPSRYRAEIKNLAEQIKTKQRRLEILGAAKPDQGPRLI